MTAAIAPALDDLDSRILECIEEYVSDYGFPPSVREIQREVGLASTSSVHHRLRRIEDAGLIRRRGNHSRAITLIKAA